MVSQATVSARHKYGLATAVHLRELDGVSTPENFHTWVLYYNLYLQTLFRVRLKCDGTR